MGGGGDSFKNEAPAHTIKKSPHPDIEWGEGGGSEDNKILDHEENSEIMIFSEQKYNFEVEMLENWMKICEIRSLSLIIIDEQIENMFKTPSPQDTS